MNSSVILVCFVVFFNALYLSTAKMCNSNNDCPFGECNMDEGLCRCNLDCSNFRGKIAQYGCTNRTDRPSDYCTEVNEACIAGNNLRIRQPSLQELAAVQFSCNAIFNSDFFTEKQFCEDQSRCSKSGVCLRNLENGSEFCMCDSAHSGDRCQNLIHHPERTVMSRLMDVSSRDETLNYTNARNQTIIIFLSTLVGILCMILFGFVFCVCCKRVKRQTLNDVEQPNEINPALRVEVNPLSRVEDNVISTTLEIKPANNEALDQ